MKKKTNTKKVAITIPEDLLAEIDEMSRHRRVSRSWLISELLGKKLSEERNRILRSVYDQVFSDEAVCREQIMATINSEN